MFRQSDDVLLSTWNGIKDGTMDLVYGITGLFTKPYKGAKEEHELFQSIKLLKSLASVNSIKAEIRKHFSYSVLFKSYLKEQTSL